MCVDMVRGHGQAVVDPYAQVSNDGCWTDEAAADEKWQTWQLIDPTL